MRDFRVQQNGFKYALLASAMSLCMLGATPALAQTAEAVDGESDDDTMGVNVIVVTASKRGNVSAQDVDGSLTAFDDKKLERLDALDFDDFIVQVPGANFISNGGAGRGNEVASIRGLSPVADNTQAVVAQYLDGAPRFGENFRLFDIGEVSVLRGPQGTLWGAQSIGGLITYQSKRPDPANFSAELQGDVYTTDNDGGLSYRVGGHLNIPILEDQIALRVAGHYIDESGYIDNVTTGVSNVDAVEEAAWRVSLLMRPFYNSEVVIAYHGNDLSSDAPTFFDLALGDFKVADPFSFSPAEQKYDLVTLNAQFDLGFADIAYSGSIFDQRRTVTDFDTNVFGFLPLAQTTTLGNLQSRTHELRLSSNNASPLQWLFGVYYDELESNDPATQFTIDASGNPTVPPFEVSVIGGREDQQELAFFGELEYSITDSLRVLIGGRYFDWEIDNQEEFTFFGSNFQQETGKVGGDDFFWKAQVSYDVNPDVTIYALRSEGFRFGGFNPFVGPALGIPTEFVKFDPDTLVNYEGGLKSVLADGRLIANASIYYMDWSDIQTVVFNESNTFAFTTNGPELEAYGAELELVSQDLIAPGVYLAASYAYTKNEFQSDAQIFPGTTPLISAGEELRRTPRHTWSLDAGYDFHLSDNIEGFVRANYWHKDRTSTEGFNSGDGAVPIPAQDIANASIGVKGESWQVKLYVDNIFNGVPLLQVFPAGAAGGPGGDVANRASSLRPRTFGIELTKSIGG